MKSAGVFPPLVKSKYKTLESSAPTGGFFLAPVEDYGPSGPKVILPDGQTDKGFKGVR